MPFHSGPLKVHSFAVRTSILEQPAQVCSVRVLSLWCTLCYSLQRTSRSFRCSLSCCTVVFGLQLSVKFCPFGIFTNSCILVLMAVFGAHVTLGGTGTGMLCCRADPRVHAVASRVQECSAQFTRRCGRFVVPSQTHKENSSNSFMIPSRSVRHFVFVDGITATSTSVDSWPTDFAHYGTTAECHRQGM